jgi:PAS domain S-box-containing protein
VRTNVVELPAPLDTATALRARVVELEAELAALRMDRPAGAERLYHLSASGPVLPLSAAARAAHPGVCLQLADLVGRPHLSGLRDYVERYRRLPRLRQPYEQLMETPSGAPVWVRAHFYDDGNGTLTMQPLADAAEMKALLALPPNTIDSAPAPVCVLDLDGRVVQASEPFAQLIQRAPEELVGLQLLEALIGGDPRSREAQSRELGWRDRVVRIKRELIRSDDSRVPVELVLERLPDGRTIGLMRPLAPTRPSDAALAAASMMFVTTDAAGRITTCQGRFLADLGLTAEGCLGDPARVLPIPGIERDISVALGGGTASARRFGNGIPIECRAAPIRDAAGGVIGASLVAMDVAESHDRQERQRHAEVRAALAQASGAAAHRLNNELLVMECHADLIKQNLDRDTQIFADIVQILDAIGGAGRVAQDLLAISERQVLEQTPTDLATVLMKLTPDFHSQLPDATRWTLSMDPSACVVDLDPEVVSRALVSLAVHCCEDGRARLPIDLSVHELDANQARWLELPERGRYAIVTIGDPVEALGVPVSGIGPVGEPLDLPEVGLRLAAANGALRQNRAVLRVMPGSTFRIYFPMVADAEIAD